MESPDPVGPFDTEGPVTLDDTTPMACALASWQDQLWLACVDAKTGMMGTTLRLRLAHTQADPQVPATHMDFSGKHLFQVPNSDAEPEDVLTSAAPALLPSGEGMYLAWTDPGGDLMITHSVTDPSPPATLPGRSTKDPALALLDGQICVAWAGTNRRLNLSYSIGGQFNAPLTLGQKSFHAPAICWSNNRSVLAWTGTDQRLNLAYATGKEFSSPITLDERSVHRPTLCPVGDELLVGWTAPGNQLVNLALVSETGNVSKTTLPVKSIAGPTLCAHRDQIFLAWINAGQRPSITRLRRV